MAGAQAPEAPDGVDDKLWVLYRDFSTETDGKFAGGNAEHAEFVSWMRERSQSRDQSVSRRQFLKGAAVGAAVSGGVVHGLHKLFPAIKSKPVPVPYPVPVVDAQTSFVEGFAQKHGFNGGLLIDRCAEFGLSPLLVLAQIEKESTFDPHAVNIGSGDKGLMQIRDDKIGLFVDSVPRILADTASTNPQRREKADATLKLIITDDEKRQSVITAWNALNTEISVGKPPRRGNPGVNPLGRNLIEQVAAAYNPYNPNQNIYVGVGFDGEMLAKFPEIASRDESEKFMLAAYCGGLGYINAALRLAREKEGAKTGRSMDKNDVSWWPPGMHEPEIFPPGKWQSWEYASPLLHDDRCFVTRGEKKIYPKAGEIIDYVTDIWPLYEGHLDGVEKLKAKGK